MAYEIKFAESVKDHMRTIEISTVANPLADCIRELGEEIIVLTRDAKPVAAIVSLEKVDRESLSLGTNPKFLEIIRKAEDEFKAGRTLSLEEMKHAVLEDEQEPGS